MFWHPDAEWATPASRHWETLLQPGAGRGFSVQGKTAAPPVIEPRCGQNQSEDLLPEVLAGEASSLESILQRGVARGEIDADKLTPPIASLLSDLFRHHALMNWSAPDADLRSAWIDSIFLPLVTVRVE